MLLVRSRETSLRESALRGIGTSCTGSLRAAAQLDLEKFSWSGSEQFAETRQLQERSSASRGSL